MPVAAVQMLQPTVDGPSHQLPDMSSSLPAAPPPCVPNRPCHPCCRRSCRPYLRVVAVLRVGQRLTHVLSQGDGAAAKLGGGAGGRAGHVGRGRGGRHAMGETAAAQHKPAQLTCLPSPATPTWMTVRRWRASGVSASLTTPAEATWAASTAGSWLCGAGLIRPERSTAMMCSCSCCDPVGCCCSSAAAGKAGGASLPLLLLPLLAAAAPPLLGPASPRHAAARNDGGRAPCALLRPRRVLGRNIGEGMGCRAREAPSADQGPTPNVDAAPLPWAMAARLDRRPRPCIA